MIIYDNDNHQVITNLMKEDEDDQLKRVVVRGLVLIIRLVVISFHYHLCHDDNDDETIVRGVVLIIKLVVISHLQNVCCIRMCHKNDFNVTEVLHF